MIRNEGNTTSRHETEPQTVVIENLAPNGLGFGEGGITVKKQIVEGILTESVPKAVHELLMNDMNAFKPVEADDDGCGDGRPWQTVMRMVDSESNKQVVEYKRSLLRPKVFGGGLVAGASMWRAVNGVPDNQDTVIQDRQLIAAKFAENGLNHGAHTDNHAEGDKCGCGAIDNYPLITANAIKYREQITDTLKVLYGDDYADNSEAVEGAFSVYESLVQSEEYFLGATGKQSMDQIIEAGATVKELYGHHIEETIVINDIENTTLDQQYFTERVKEMSEEKPRIVQAFTVDVWRGRQLAEAIARIKAETDPSADINRVYKTAMADFLIRTLAVASTLTAGDLPVYRRRTDN